MPQRTSRRDHDVDPRVIWSFLYWSIKGAPQGVNRRQRRQVGHRGGRVEKIDPLEFFRFYNRLETTEADAGRRVGLLLDWLSERVDAATVDKAYRRALQSARRWHGARPPSTYLESKARGERLLREDFERRVREVGREQALEELHRRPD